MIPLSLTRSNPVITICNKASHNYISHECTIKFMITIIVLFSCQITEIRSPMHLWHSGIFPDDRFRGLPQVFCMVIFILLQACSCRDISLAFFYLQCYIIILFNILKSMQLYICTLYWQETVVHADRCITYIVSKRHACLHKTA